jgi:hypothetical protein|eukprot:COSAG01_NODE_6738_length_3522_cov_4.122407_3_plen_221_part_00
MIVPAVHVAAGRRYLAAGLLGGPHGRCGRVRHCVISSCLHGFYVMWAGVFVPRPSPWRRFFGTRAMRHAQHRTHGDWKRSRISVSSRPILINVSPWGWGRRYGTVFLAKLNTSQPGGGGVSLKRLLDESPWWQFTSECQRLSPPLRLNHSPFWAGKGGGLPPGHRGGHQGDGQDVAAAGAAAGQHQAGDGHPAPVRTALAWGLGWVGGFGARLRLTEISV